MKNRVTDVRLELPYRTNIVRILITRCINGKDVEKSYETNSRSSRDKWINRFFKADNSFMTKRLPYCF